MRRSISTILAGAVIVLWAGAAVAGPNMSEGKWEITSKMEMEGMPMAMPPTKTTMCLNPKETVPQKPSKNEDCKFLSRNIEGNTVTWVMQCKDKHGTMESKGKITYHGNTFEGKVVMDMNHGGRPQTMKQELSGRRIGDCK